MIILILFIASFIAFAEKDHDFTAEGRRKVQNENGQYVKITPENLHSLAPKASEDILNNIKPLLNNEEFIRKVVVQEGLESKIKDRDENARNYLAENGFELVQKSGNYVFKLGNYNTDYLMKISGPGNRRKLKTAGHGMAYGQSYKISPEFLDAYYNKNEHGQPFYTYQTASRIAHGLLFKQFLKECSACEGVRAIEEYLVNLPGREGKVDDTSCVVLSKIEPDLRPLTAEELNKIPVDRIVALWAGMRYSGGWNMTKENVQITPNNEIVLLDFEQPNTTKPIEMFNRIKERWAHNVSVGEDTLLTMIGKDSLPAKAIAEAKKLKVLESKDKFNGYIKELKSKSNDNNNNG